MSVNELGVQPTFRLSKWMINELPLSGAERVPAAIRQTFVQVVPSLAVPGLAGCAP